MPFSEKEYEGKTSGELLAKIKELTEKAEAKPAEKPVETVVPAVEPKLTDPKPADKPAPVVTVATDNKQLTELQAQNKTMADQLKQLTEDKRKNSIEKKMSDYSTAGMPPVIVESAKAILMSENAESKTFKFSEKDSEGKVTEKDHSFAECIYSLLDSIPVVTLGETTVVLKDGGSDLGDKSQDKKDIELVKKYAEDNKVTFKAARSKLLSEGKIQPYDSGVIPE